MIGVIVEVILAVIILLYCLYSGFFISIMANTPFIELVYEFFENYLGVTSGGPSPFSTGQIFAMEICKTILYLIIFYIMGKAAEQLTSVGRHEYYSTFKKIFLAPISIFIKYFLSALITTMITSFVMDFLKDWIASQTILSILLFAVITLLLLAAGLWLTADSLVQYVMWVLVNVFGASALRLVAIEALVVFAYFILNVPGALEGVGTIVIMVIGIVVCIGSVIGTEFFEDWIPAGDGKLYRRRR